MPILSTIKVVKHNSEGHLSRILSIWEIGDAPSIGRCIYLKEDDQIIGVRVNLVEKMQELGDWIYMFTLMVANEKM